MSRLASVVSGFAALAFGLAVSVQSAKADLIYDLTFVPSSGSSGGTGVLDLTGSVYPTSATITSASIPPGPTFVSLDATVGGVMFDITSLGTNDQIVITGGLPTTIDTSGTGAGPSALGYVNNLNYVADIGGVFTFGTITVTAVPEASTWAMMILGFIGVGFMAWRQKAKGQASMSFA